MTDARLKWRKKENGYSIQTRKILAYWVIQLHVKIAEGGTLEDGKGVIEIQKDKYGHMEYQSSVEEYETRCAILPDNWEQNKAATLGSFTMHQTMTVTFENNVTVDPNAERLVQAPTVTGERQDVSEFKKFLKATEFIQPMGKQVTPQEYVQVKDNKCDITEPVRTLISSGEDFGEDVAVAFISLRNLTCRLS